MNLSFQMKILLLSYFTSSFLSLIIVPLLRKLKIKQSERDVGPESHLHKNGTTTMGGLIIILSTIILSVFLYFNYSLDQPEIATRLLPMIFVTVGFGIVGFVDDFKKVILGNSDGISAKAKMIGLALISILYILMLLFVFNNGTDIFIPFVKTYITLPIWLYIIFALFVILGTTNAINLTDGVDGLAAGVSTLIVSALTIISILWNVKEITIFGCIIIGSILGFLMLNLHPAHIFMGDTGSLLVGGAIAGIALYMKLPFLLVILAIIHVIETISVILQVAYFKKTRKILFKMAPIHHHFELSGWKETSIVIVFCFITLIACGVGLIAI